ncbi:hypothetical protein COO60DRAFT_1691478 [Scenedesmus sp. NREL 46B-D3]|nr:hypothetical protein COO60DRAFT_1691478 [Scenedesmus sp. NREL 46B-D3]
MAGEDEEAADLDWFCGPSNALQLRLWPFPSRCKPAARDKQQKTILIMMSNTGGGHKASAEALKQAFEEKHGDKYRVRSVGGVLIVDMWKEHTPHPWSTLPDSYSFLVKHGMLWRLAYTSIQPRSIHVPYFAAMRAFVGRHIAEAFDSYDPDLVVSVHPLMQHINSAVLRERAKRLGAPARRPSPRCGALQQWAAARPTACVSMRVRLVEEQDVDKCFVPTEFCRQLGLGMGLRPSQLVLYGLPIRPIFSKKLPGRNQLRKKLGLLPDLPAVLLVGGGEGMGKLKATVEQLDARLQGNAQVAVICGRNKQLLQELRGKQWPGGSHVVACGFVDNIHEVRGEGWSWMAAVDTIITKAGPGTIAEALISGLPILLNGNVPCQEEGNIPYVVDNGVGAFETDPAKIADIMEDWLAQENRQEFRNMAHRSRALGKPQAVYDIVEDLAHMADTLGAEARQLARQRCGSDKSRAAELPVGQLATA